MGGLSILLDKAAASTATPSTPGFLSAQHEFNEAIYIALDVCTALTALCGVLSVAALVVQLARKDQRRLVQKTVKPEGTYLLPHSPVMAPISITLYSIVGMVTCLVMKAYLYKGSNLVVIQRLVLLLPMPVLLWAWLSAFANAFAWHLTPMPESGTLKLLRFKPKTLNWVCWLTPLAIFVMQLAIVIEWPYKSASAKLAKHNFELLESTLAPGDPVLEASRVYALHLSHVAEAYYKSAWAIWALSYATCWAIYTTYSCLLLRLLGRQKEFVDSITPVQQDDAKDEEADPSGKRPSMSERMTAIRRASSSTIKDLRRSSQSSEARRLSKRQLLRRNTKLIAIELVSYSIFTLCWSFLAIVKAALGYKILNNATTGPITLLGELYESSIFGTIAVTLLLFRGINILRNRAPEQQPDFIGASESRRQSLSESLAARRGKTAISIAMNVGNYIVVGSSAPATPAYEGPTVPAPVLMVQLPTSSSPGSPASGYFESEKAVPQIKRKASVTFTDGLGLPPQHVAVPTLSLIAASPQVPQTENTWMPPSEWVYPVNSPQ